MNLKVVSPYKWFDDVSKLECNQLPPPSAFYRSLKETCISDADYQTSQQAKVDHNMTIFRDFLVWYNNLDVGPLSPLWRDCNSFTLIEIPICLKLPCPFLALRGKWYSTQQQGMGRYSCYWTRITRIFVS